jgi:hypothetical protein
MYVVTRRVTLRSVEEAAQKAAAGLVPILKRSPGFRGYHIVDGGGGLGLSIAVFDSEESAARIRDEAMGWIQANIASSFTSEPLMTTGEVILSVEPDAPSAQPAGAQTGAPGAVIH